MKPLLFCLSIIFSVHINAQSEDELAVKKTIIDFFDAFHKQDTVALKSFAIGNIKMQSIGRTKEGETKLKTDDYNSFIKGIASIPKENKFEEKLTGFTINIDENMATAWTPYEFWYKGQFSHCGVNSFQLIKENDMWKIIYLVDTRRRDNCVQKNPKD